MTETYAFIVGIEKYDQPKWDVPGPCQNAVGMAEWLLSIGTVPGKISVFLEPITDLSARVDALKAAGVKVTANGLWEPIDTFSRVQLPAGSKPGSRLFVYWSGHGFVQSDGTRVLICKDYTAQAKSNRVFNATNFLRHLLIDSRFQSFRQQIVLADVCGIRSQYNGLTFEPTHKPPKDSGQTADQTAFFATPEGEYAHEDDGEGVFTRVARKVLCDGGGWPEGVKFKEHLLSELTNAGQVPFYIEGNHRNFVIPPRLVGYDPESSGNVLAHSLHSVLSGINLPDSVFRPHYLRTVNDLGQPELTKAQGLLEMVRELYNLQDEASSGKVPYGLLEFLVRLSEKAELRVPVETWLAERAAGQNNDLANIRERLAAESRVKILLIEVENDAQGQIVSFESFLRTNDLSRAVGSGLPAQSVVSWEDFCAKVGDVVRTLRADLSIADFEIHFLANPPLFDKAFHQIPLSPAGTLGEEFVVILRHRERVRYCRPTILQPWIAYAAALRQVKPRRLKLNGVCQGGSLDRVLEKKGFCYTEFVMPVESTLSSRPTNEKRLLVKLLNLGVPYLYLLHEVQPEPGWSKVLEKAIRNWLEGLPSLDRLPSALRERRTGGSPFASEGTLLWDDPEFIPFFTTAEVIIK
jgi:hypothetical protein